MNVQKCLHINKISTVILKTSHSMVKKELYALKQLIKESEKTAAQTSELIAILRQDTARNVFTAVTERLTYMILSHALNFSWLAHGLLVCS